MQTPDTNAKESQNAHPSHSDFSWKGLGNIKEGRGDLGESMPVLVYRLLQYSMLDVLSKQYGFDEANEIFRRAGHIAGLAFARNTLNLEQGFDPFMANLKATLLHLKVGKLNLEMFEPVTGSISLTVAQDLDCSGLPDTDENACMYDEGFIAGILEAYTGKPYRVREINCWASGADVCRFYGSVAVD